MDATAEKPGVFSDVVMSSSRDIVQSDGTQMSTTTGTGVQYTVLRPIPYGTFLSRIMRVTSVPITVLHQAMVITGIALEALSAEQSHTHI